ncbi:MAG: hypothetical protein JO082_13560 [Mycobacterium sp.]|nr:hypothetical protein [Mycobacterium sp.]MBV9722927.1 hypothetical protein [Mycobacterium sp.]
MDHRPHRPLGLHVEHWWSAVYAAIVDQLLWHVHTTRGGPADWMHA